MAQGYRGAWQHNSPVQEAVETGMGEGAMAINMEQDGRSGTLKEIREIDHC